MFKSPRSDHDSIVGGRPSGSSIGILPVRTLRVRDSLVNAMAQSFGYYGHSLLGRHTNHGKTQGLAFSRRWTGWPNPPSFSPTPPGP